MRKEWLFLIFERGMSRVPTLSLEGMWVSDLNPLKGARWLGLF